MPKTTRPKLDISQLAKRILDEATGEVVRQEEPAKVKATRVAGKAGGRSRAATLTPEQRADIARLAAQARWKKS